MLTKPKVFFIIVLSSMFGCNSKQSIDMNLTSSQTTFGAEYSNTSTAFKVWSPIADNMVLRIYSDGHRSSLIEKHQMY